MCSTPFLPRASPFSYPTELRFGSDSQRRLRVGAQLRRALLELQQLPSLPQVFAAPLLQLGDQGFDLLQERKGSAASTSGLAMSRWGEH